MTRITDEDADGRADHFRTLAMSGVFGITMSLRLVQADKDGNVWVALILQIPLLGRLSGLVSESHARRKNATRVQWDPQSLYRAERTWSHVLC